MLHQRALDRGLDEDQANAAVACGLEVALEEADQGDLIDELAA